MNKGWRVPKKIEAPSRAEDTIIVSVPQVLSQEACDELRARVAREFPGRHVAIASGGTHISTLGQAEHLKRLEQKIDLLLDLLVEDDDEPSDDGVMHTLDGDQEGAARDTGSPL